MVSTVLESIKPVIEQADHVTLNTGRLDDFCAGFTGLDSSFKSPFRAVRLSPEDKLQLDLVYNAANFCYWGDPKWTVHHQGREISGAYGMKAAFNRALEEGFRLLDPSYLQTLSETDFAQITRGSGSLPLFNERIRFLRQVGTILKARYNGKATNVVAAGEGDALRLLDEITTNFPCYRDTATFKGKKVLFHKRAQLLTHNAHKVLEAQGNGLTRTEELTALADYKVPQLLRNRGVLEYAPELAECIDTYQEIPAGSPEEVEIRAFTLEAVNQMVANLRPRFPGLKAIDLDRWLYLESKKTSPMDKPHHRALTTAH